MKKYIFTEEQIKGVMEKKINGTRKGGKNVLFTESQIKKVLKTIIDEQTDDRNIKKTIQCFLNKRLKLNLRVDGLFGDDTTKAIAQFQEMKGVVPVDGVWGEKTINKLNPKEFKVMDACESEHSDFIDRGLRLLNLK